MGEVTTELEFDVADRLRKALRYADVGVGEMAEYLGISRNSAGRYINGRVTPDRRTLRLWAIRCRVPYDWLVTGELEELPRLDSNQQPAGCGNETISTAELAGFLRHINVPAAALAAAPGRRTM